MLPFRVYEFDEGVMITDAMPGYDGIIGREILAVNGRPTAEVLAALEPLVPRDGPATVPGFRPIFFPRTSVLRGLGLIDEGSVRIEVAGVQPREREVEPVLFDEWFSWAGGNGAGLPSRDDTLFLSRPDDDLWWDRIDADDDGDDGDDGEALYVRYQRVAPLTGRTGLAADIDAGGFERLVLDRRQNPGGDNHNFPPLLDLLDAYDEAHPGSLFVLTDRLTFSAASNFATSIEQATDATFAGEPMGGGLNFWNDVDWVQLPSFPVPMQVGVSTRYWQFATADDERLTIRPDIAVPTLSSDYFAGADRVLEAVLGSE